MHYPLLQHLPLTRIDELHLDSGFQCTAAFLVQCCDVCLEVGARAECEEAATEADSHLPCDQQWRGRSGFREVTSDLAVCGFVVASGSYAQTHKLSVARVF